MHVLVPVIWLPFPIQPIQPVCDLHIESLAVRWNSAQEGVVANFGKLSDDLWIFFLADDVKGLDPFRGGRHTGLIDAVTVNRCADLKSQKLVRPAENVCQPGPVVVNVAEIAPAVNRVSPSVPDTDAVVQIQSAGWH